MKTSTMKNPGFVVAAMVTAAAGVVLANTPAHAAASDDVTSVTVRFGDLDLSTAKGSELLYIRLKNAAGTVCGDDDSFVELEEIRGVRECEQATMAAAVAQVDRPRLTALYDYHFPREPLTAATRVSYAPATREAPARLDGQAVDVVVRRA